MQLMGKSLYEVPNDQILLKKLKNMDNIEVISFNAIFMQKQQVKIAFGHCFDGKSK